MRTGIGALVAVASALVSGCMTSAGDGNELDSDCHITWLDDGVMRTATTGNATWASAAGTDSVHLFGAIKTLGIEIYAATPTPFTAQTLVCGQTTSDQSLLLTYRNDNPAGPAIQSESCKVGFTQIGAVGAPVIGTFEVVFDLPGGGTKSITNGTFELPLSK